MAANYWDYDKYTTGWADSTRTGTTLSEWSSTTAGWTTATTNYYQTVRKYLVSAPEHWDKEIRANFTKLINDDTNTGFMVTMWIDGDIEIIDPTIERREMKDFVLLLKSKASQTDKDIINSFLDKYLSV